MWIDESQHSHDAVEVADDVVVVVVDNDDGDYDDGDGVGFVYWTLTIS